MTASPATAPSSAERSFKRYKEDVKERGKPFFPYAMFHDTVMSLVVVVVIIGLAVRLVLHVPGDDGERGRAGSGRSTTRRPTPGRRASSRGPDWYFYFLFYLLRIFKWPETVDPRHGRDPDDPADPPARAAVLRPAPRAAAARAGRSRSSPASSSSSRWACSPTRARPRRRSLGARDRRRSCGVGARSRASPTTRPRSRARRSSPRPAACNCHTYLGAGLDQPRRARPHRRSAPKRPGRRLLQRYVADPRAVREQRDAEVRRGRSARSSCTQLAIVPRRLEGRAGAAAEPLRPRCARLPRDNRRLRRAVRGAAARGARRGRLRGRDLRVARRASRCSRPSSTATPRCRATRCSRASPRARAARVTVYDPNDWQRAVRERLGAGRRLRRLPVLDGDARHARRRRDGEPDPPRGVASR